MLLLIIARFCEAVEHQCDRIEDSDQGRVCEFENVYVNEPTVLQISEAPNQEVEAVRFRNSTLLRIPAELFRIFSQLKHVDFDATGLNKIDPSNFESASEMKFFLARFNQIKRIAARTFATCTKLEYIVMSHNSISQIEEHALEGLANLEAVFLDNNQLTSLPEKLLLPSENLQFFSMSNNKLIQIPDDFFTNSEKLLALNLADNLLTSFNEKQFEKLTNLEHLRLDHNLLNALNFNSCGAVEIIIDNNNLQELEVSKMTRYISANGNPFRRIILHEHYGSRQYNFSFDLVNEIVFFVAEHCCTAESLENFQDLIHPFGDLAEKQLDVHDWECKFEKTVAYRNEENRTVFNDACKRRSTESATMTTTMQNDLSEVEKTTLSSAEPVESTNPPEMSTTTEPGVWKAMKRRVAGWKNKAKSKLNSIG